MLFLHFCFVDIISIIYLLPSLQVYPFLVRY